MWYAMATSSIFVSMSELIRIEPAASGVENMRTDEALLDACALGTLSRIVRIYGFAPPCLSLGRMQSDACVDFDACTRDGVEVVRRPSGGSAVLHDREVTYAVVCRTDDADLGGTVLESCARIHRVIADALATLGVETTAHAETGARAAEEVRRSAVADCFSRPSEHEILDLQGQKLVGSAQARRGHALLQHGSVLLEPHRAATYLSSTQPRGRSSSLAEVLQRDASFEEVAAAVAAAFERVLAART